jgi:hypothetical protein
MAAIAAFAWACAALVGFDDVEFAHPGDAGSVDGSVDAVADDAFVEAAEAFINPFRCTDAAGLVGMWTLDEGEGGVAHDCSGNGLDGMLFASPGEVLPMWVPGHRGTGLAFFPVDGGISLLDLGQPWAANYSTEGLTVAAWVNSSPGQGTILGRGANVLCGGSCMCDQQEQFGLQVLGGGSNFHTGAPSLQAGVPSACGYVSLSGPLLVSGTWTFMAGVAQPGVGLFLYTGSRKVFSAFADGGTPFASNNFRLSMGAAAFFPAQQGTQLLGAIDEVYLFNRALTPEEIVLLASD